MELKGLIAGLGNPGSQYAATRHNMGFAAVQSFLEHARRQGAAVEPVSGSRFKAELWKITLSPQATWLTAMPQPFMNLSGESIQPLLNWYRIPTENLLVIHDELDLPPGKIKLQLGGSPAGHNGLKSIQQRLGSAGFYRLRIGVGRPPDRDNAISWVLGRFPADEAAVMEKTFPFITQVISCYVDEGPVKAMNMANDRRNIVRPA
jgi:PTH1 family peptidyl-tRNA hydrolase